MEEPVCMTDQQKFDFINDINYKNGYLAGREDTIRDIVDLLKSYNCPLLWTNIIYKWYTEKGRYKDIPEPEKEENIDKVILGLLNKAVSESNEDTTCKEARENFHKLIDEYVIEHFPPLGDNNNN